jgi:uncharacterized repeat protein (TIGR01451 family)
MPVVSPPALTVLKSANKASVAPGDIITYTETITNTGTGTAMSVVVTDSLSPYVQLGLSSYSSAPFKFTDGAPASGLTLGMPVYSNDHGATWTYVPSGTYDGNVTNWSIPMSGTMNANGTNFTINYKVRVN